MSDPYLTLGIKPSATDDEVKHAYRDLVKKYHPDSYQNNPLSDLAEEKMKEINEAYDTIVKQRSSGGYQSGGQSYGGSSSHQSSDPTLAQVRRLLDSGQLNEAQQLLERSSARTAEWHYLMGGLAYRRGWLSDAQNYFAMACQMEPGNMEYRQAAMHLQTQAGRGGQNYRNTGGCNTSDLCSAFICYSCCCDGCG